MKIEKILEEYNYSITDKRLWELLDSIGISLNDANLAQPVSTGLFKSKTTYVPSRDAVHFVIDMVRAELLEDTELTEDIAALVVLLDKSKLLKTYFSDYEQKEIKEKLKETANSKAGKLIKSMIEYVENMIAVMTTLIVFYS